MAAPIHNTTFLAAPPYTIEPHPSCIYAYQCAYLPMQPRKELVVPILSGGGKQQ